MEITREQIEKIVQDYLDRNQFSTKSAFQAPLHRHNGSDSPKITMADLTLDARGLIFPTNNGNAVIDVFNDNITGYGYLQIKPQTGDINIHRFTIGEFDSVGIYAGNLGFTLNCNGGGTLGDVPRSGVRGESTYTEVYAYTSLTDYSQVIFAPDAMGATRSGSYWYFHFAECASLPPSPVLGDVCYYNNHLQVCESAGSWTQK